MSMIRPTKLLLALGTLSLVLLGLTSCGGNSGDVGESAAQLSRLSLVVTTDQSLSRRLLLAATPPQLRQVPGEPGFVSRLEVNIQAQDIEPITQSFFVTVEQQTAVTVQLRVPKGENREITVSAFNAEDIKIFENETIVPLIQDIESVTIALKRVLAAIEVTPPIPAIAEGTTQQFTATGLLAEGTTQNLTTLPEITWTSSDTTVASISNVDGSRGLATALAPGTTTITASFTEDTTTITASSASISGSAPLTVTPAVVETITVTPPAPTIADGTTQQFTATGTFTDGTTQDLTTQVTWVSSDESLVVVSNAVGSQGLATALDSGSPITITAFFASISGSATLTVTPADVETITVTPPAPTIAAGTTQQFTATGTFTDATTQDLTTQVTWASSDGSVASISNAVGSQGLATALAPGSITITAAFGAVSGFTTLTVTPEPPVSITVTPANPTIAVGTTQQFTATGILADSTTQDLTTQVTWASSDGSVAVVSNAAGSQGLATALAPGTTTITASFTGVQGTTTLEVLEPADLIPIPDSFGVFCIRDSLGDLIVTVQNQGAGSAGPFRTTVDFGSFGSESQSTFVALAPDESVDLFFSIPLGCFDPDCSFDIIVDDLNEVPETDETNNTAGDTCIG